MRAREKQNKPLQSEQRGRNPFHWILGLSGVVWIAFFSGFQCGPTLKDCALASDCASNETCVQYRCQLRDYCEKDDDCTSPRTCINNQCSAPVQGCKADKDCNNGRICKAGSCVEPVVPGCTTDKDCTAPRVCQNKLCVDPTVPPCKADTDCATGQECKAGVCTKKPACTADADCGTGLSCQNGQCVKVTGPCKTDVECQSGETCQNGVCTPTSTGLCKLTSAPTSVSFSEIILGTKKTQDIELSNEGTGVCRLANATIDKATGTSLFRVTGFTAKNLAAGEKTKLTIEFDGKGVGNSNATLEIASTESVLSSIRLYGYVKVDPTLPAQGWAVALADSDPFGSSHIAGCFWDNNTFETVTSNVFTEGGFNLGYGNMRKTTDAGSTWKCANCTSGSSWPRQAYYEIVDMRIAGMACQGGIGYIYGSFDNPPPTMTPSVFYRTATTSWQGINDSNNPLSSGASFNDGGMFAANNEWFLLMGSFVTSFTPGSDGKVGTQKLRYMSNPQGLDRPYFRGIEIAHNTALLAGLSRKFSGRSVVYENIIVYNTNSGQIPPNITTPEQVATYWPKANSPCTSCSITKGIVIGAKSFLLAVAKVDANRNPLGSEIWRTDNLGQSWTRVYQGTHKNSATGDLLQVDSNRIFAVFGGPYSSMGSSGEQGILLESTDGGVSFKEVPLSTMKGKTVQNGTMPSLHKLVISPDRKTVFALGMGVILRWKQ